MPKQSPAERLFTLTCCLLAAPRIGLSRREIYQSVQAYVETSDDSRDKMFDRDKGILREMGVSIEVVEFTSFEDTDSSRYRIPKGTFDWPSDLVLTSQQFQLLELAARAWNNRLMGSSAQSGLTRLKALGLTPKSRDLTIFTPRLISKHQSFDPLALAISGLRKVEFLYRKPDMAATMRLVEPQKLRFIEGQWVLLAKENGSLKNFLLRRIVSEVTTRDGFDGLAPDVEIAQAEADLQALVDSQVAILEAKPDTEAWWHFSASDSGKIELHFMDEALLAEDLMEFGGELEVIEPASLAQRIRKGLEEVVKAHA